MKYLIKWKDLTYDMCTWESADWVIDKFEYLLEEYRSVLNRKMSPVENREYSQMKTPPSSWKEKGLELYEYQMNGVNWMRKMWSEDKSCILGDEMGLGKTVQAIAFLSSLIAENYSWGPFLIVVPLSTVGAWKVEIEKWGSNMYCVEYVGSSESRRIIQTYEAIKLLDTNPKFHILLTTFEVFLSDEGFFKTFSFDILVVDEAHRLKNSKSKIYQGLERLKRNTSLFMTGTPLQNSLEELFNILHLMDPSDFANKEAFLSYFEGSGLTAENLSERTKHVLKGRILRRFKAEVLRELPPKEEIIVKVSMSDKQKAIYRTILIRNFPLLNTGPKGIKQTSFLNVMMELRKCCNHPLLFPSESYHFEKENKSKPSRVEQIISMSGKLIVLEKMLKRLKDQNHRVLIFSQMTSFLTILEEVLAYLGMKFLRLDGSTPSTARKNLIDLFNSKQTEYFCFLLSTRAGGLGINLASADTIIIYDSDWNPHNDIQASNRSHRIGQKSKVVVYRFLTVDTVEEKVLSLAEKKLLLMDIFVNNAAAKNHTAARCREICMHGVQALLDGELSEDVENGHVILYDDAQIEKLLDRREETVQNNILESRRLFDAFQVVDLSDSHEKEMKMLSERYRLYTESELADNSGRRKMPRINYNEQEEEEKSELLFTRISSEDFAPFTYSKSGEIDEICGFSVKIRAVIASWLHRFGFPSFDKHQTVCNFLEASTLKNIPVLQMKTYFSMYGLSIAKASYDKCSAQLLDSFSCGVFKDPSPFGILSHTGTVSLFRKGVALFLKTSDATEEQFIGVLRGVHSYSSEISCSVLTSLRQFNVDSTDTFGFQNEWLGREGNAKKCQDLCLVLVNYIHGYCCWKRICRRYKFRDFSNSDRDATMSSKQLDARFKMLSVALVIKVQEESGTPVRYSELDESEQISVKCFDSLKKSVDKAFQMCEGGKIPKDKVSHLHSGKQKRDTFFTLTK